MKPPNDESVLKYLQLSHLAAGISGGVASTLILHPLDLLKIRFAVSDGRTPSRHYRGLRHAVESIYYDEGWRGFFKGVTPNIVGCGASWGLYFYFYQAIKRYMQDGDGTVSIGPVKHMLAAAESGAMTLVLTNPIWVIKTRLCLQYCDTDPKNAYHGIIDCFDKIQQTEGFRGLYKGFLPGLLGVSHGAIQFMVYEELKSWHNKKHDKPINAQLETQEYILFAAVSKLLAASLTFPYQVIRSRLQDQHRSYKGFRDCVIKTYVWEGWRAFYKGLTPSLIRVVPSTVITFLVYENMSSALSKLRPY